MRAARYGYLAVVRQLANAGANVTLAASYNGYTALHWAAIKGFPEIAKFLLQRGANPFAVNVFGEDAMTWALRNRRPRVQQAILAWK